MTAPGSAAGSVVPLADIIAGGAEDQEPTPGFVAWMHGENVEVTAVPERTAVVAPIGDRWADKQVVRLADLLVDPEAITWGPKAVSTGFTGRRRRYTPQERQAQRAASDRRARADQARQGAAQAAARQIGPPPRPVRTTPTCVDTTTSRPLASVTSQRAITASAPTAATSPVASEARQPVTTLASELRRARQRIAELEAELERHRAVERDVLRRVEFAVGRRAA